MNERILNLLSLCLQAKEKGYDVFFEYTPHVQKGCVHKYKDCDENLDYVKREFEFYISFYIDEENAEQEIDIAIDRVKQLIGSDVK